MATFDLPLTGAMTVSDSHTVSKPVYLVEVKDGKWVPKMSPSEASRGAIARPSAPGRRLHDRDR